MCQPNNVWVESWISATPIPAYKQKRLFDDTKEAEKVLHYLSNIKVCDLALLLLPSILHSALNVLKKRQGIINSLQVNVFKNTCMSYEIFRMSNL